MDPNAKNPAAIQKLSIVPIASSKAYIAAIQQAKSERSSF